MAGRKSIPFKKVAEQVDLLDVCQLLGIELKKQGRTYRGQCPECDNDRMAITPGEGFICHQCDLKGDVIALVKAWEGFSDMWEAANFLVEQFDLPFGNSTISKRRNSTVPDRRNSTVTTEPAERAKGRQKPDTLTKAEKVARRLDPAHERVAEMGLDPDEAEGLSVGYAKAGTLRGHVGILIRDEEGNPVRYFAAEGGHFCPVFDEGGEDLGPNVVPLKRRETG